MFLSVAGLALGYVAWIFVARAVDTARWKHARSADSYANSEFARIYGGKDVKILQFYARDGSLVEGDKSVICYGVVNARSVRIDPPIEGVSPSINRCVEVAPERGTRYTLTAEGNDGRTVSESFVLGVHADQRTLPRITQFAVTKRERDYTGKWIFSLRFSCDNPEEVSIDPPAFPTLHRSPMGSFYVAPPETTTYTLTVTGKYGHTAQRSLTVVVPKEGEPPAPLPGPRRLEPEAPKGAVRI
jgi:hypothetical protein